VTARSKRRHTHRRPRPVPPAVAQLPDSVHAGALPPHPDVVSWWWMLPVVAAPVLAFALAWWVTK